MACAFGSIFCAHISARGLYAHLEALYALLEACYAQATVLRRLHAYSEALLYACDESTRVLQAHSETCVEDAMNPPENCMCSRKRCMRTLLPREEIMCIFGNMELLNCGLRIHRMSV